MRHGLTLIAPCTRQVNEAELMVSSPTLEVAMSRVIPLNNLRRSSMSKFRVVGVHFHRTSPTGRVRVQIAVRGQVTILGHDGAARDGGCARFFEQCAFSRSGDEYYRSGNLQR